MFDQVYQTLRGQYPSVKTFLIHETPFQLLVATILSAQCTDERVNKVTPALFKRFSTVESFAKADVDELVVYLRSVNFFNNKSKNIKKMAQQLLDRYSGEVPQTLEALVTLAGVGRKTANVVLSQAFDVPGIPVDTHVGRLVYRLGYTQQCDPVKVERDLMTLWPQDIWSEFSTLLIVLGRKTCKAQRPTCTTCIVASFCPKIGLNAS